LAANVEKPDRDYLKLFKPREVSSPEGHRPARLCPHCQAAMTEFNFAYDSNIFLDRCPRCRGIWTDPSEIIKVAEHMKMDPRVYEVAQDLTKENPAIRDTQKTETVIRVIYSIVVGLFLDIDS
jgi:Zn-finger nucleic acid-binding protein